MSAGVGGVLLPTAEKGKDGGRIVVSKALTDDIISLNESQRATICWSFC